MSRRPAVLMLGKDLSLDRVLVEPCPGSLAWFRAVYARLLLMREAPLWREKGIAPAIARRLRTARWRPSARTGERPRLELQAEAWPERRRLWRRPGLIGTSRPRLVLVGERPSRVGGLPFFSRSGLWLLQALRLLGHDELSLLLTNALDAGDRSQVGSLRRLVPHLDRSIWIALGGLSCATLRAARIPAIEVPHPQWHLRFHFSEQPAGYAERLERLGVPRGPWSLGPPVQSLSGDLVLAEIMKVPVRWA